MVKKVLFLILFFYILTLFQTSFLIHFGIKGVIPNFILIAVIFISFFENHKKNLAIPSAFIGGFFLDVFSSRIIGSSILILVGLAILIKFLKNYVRLA